jgi:non-heme chloroperoxidase
MCGLAAASQVGHSSQVEAMLPAVPAALSGKFNAADTVVRGRTGIKTNRLAMGSGTVGANHHSNQTAPAAWKQGFVTTSDGVRLHYIEAGSGASIVLQPGWTMPADIWEPQINALSKSFHVVAIDPRSQGKSDRPTDGHYPERRAQDIKEVIDKLQLAPVTLVGWSLGVTEVLTYIDQFGTSTLRGLALVDGEIGHDPDPKRAADLWARAKEYQIRRAAWTAQFVRSMYKKPQSEAYLKKVTDAAMSVPTNSALLLVLNAYASGRDWRPVLSKIDKPVLYLISTTSKDQAEALKEKVPSSRIEIFGDAGHALFVDESDRFNSSIAEFVAENQP